MTKTHPYVEVMEYTFLEHGHSYFEVDSMHSANEKEMKMIPVYTVHDWVNIFKKGRSKRNRNKTEDPYQVQVVSWNFTIRKSFLNF